MPWGEIQYTERSGVRLPIHGGYGRFIFSAIYSPLVEGEGYSKISAGNSYIQAVNWDESDCPDAYGILAYSQSVKPELANHADMTELYANSGWIDMPFCDMAIEAQELRRQTIQE